MGILYKILQLSNAKRWGITIDEVTHYQSNLDVVGLSNNECLILQEVVDSLNWGFYKTIVRNIKDDQS